MLVCYVEDDCVTTGLFFRFPESKKIIIYTPIASTETSPSIFENANSLSINMLLILDIMYNTAMK